jgi:HK97 family phage portal protein
MGFFDFLRSAKAEQAGVRPRAEASGGISFSGLDDPAFLEFIRGATAAGGEQGRQALRNMAVLRCTTLISEAIGMLPFNLIYNDNSKGYATEHPAYRLFKLRPNKWQTPLEFKRLMEMHVLFDGNAYARVIRAGSRPIALIPMDPRATKAELSDNWDMVYKFTRKDGSQIVLPGSDVLHLRDLSMDGITGMSRVKLAGGAIDLALQAELAAGRTFKSGVMAGGAIEVPDELSDKAYGRFKESLNSEYSGAQNAGKYMILEGGAKASKLSNTASDAQHIENRSHQIEEVARAFGVPRPLMMMDDTAWGSGIEQLAIFFVQYALAHRFTLWEQAAARVMLSEQEMQIMQFKYNERALLRGTLKDQADFFAKSLGAGGQAPWMTQNEVRELSDLPRSSEAQANSLKNQMSKVTKNEPPPAS